MASLAAVNSLSGLKKVQSLMLSSGVSTSSTSSSVVCSAGNPWAKIGKAMVASSFSLLVANTSANAVTVKLGAEDGSLVFVPSSVTVAPGEKIVFENNKGFPHNVMFDEVPEGVKAAAISHEYYMNAGGEKFVVELTIPGEYGVYCEPHLGAGMKLTINVK
ncbi:unnamed protein product [Calypogeia fissa]